MNEFPEHNDGTSIDGDFAEDGSALEVDRYFYSGFPGSVAKPDWSDAQLRPAAPAENAWHFDVGRLAALGYVESKWRFRVTTTGRQLVGRLEPMIDRSDGSAVCNERR